MKFSMFDPSRVVLLLIPVLLVSVGCGNRRGEPNPRKIGARPDSIPIQVSTAEVKDLHLTKTFSGTLEGEEQATIAAKISERITSINFRVGDLVKSGQTVVALDKSGPSSQYYQAEASFTNAQKNFQRMKSLFKEGAISQQSLDAAQTAYDIAKANFDGARSSVELTSPISGVVTAVNVNVGDLATPGIVLMTVANISRMKVIFNIGEGDIPKFSFGQTVSIYTEVKPDRAVEGRIVQLSKSADVRSRSFEVKALFTNTADRWFKPGMFCKVEVELLSRKASLVIPNAAIMSDGTKKSVFVIEQGRAFQRSVQAGETDGQLTEILQGLKKGDPIATVGLNDLKDSSLVMIVRR